MLAAVIRWDRSVRRPPARKASADRASLAEAVSRTRQGPPEGRL
jgi:hypothetical protein